jgi:hypothetical protein
MEVIIKFSDENAANDARTALDGYKWKLAVWDLDQKLRSVVKYNTSLIKHNEMATDTEIDVADKLREELRDILNEYNINLED